MWIPVNTYILFILNRICIYTYALNVHLNVIYLHETRGPENMTLLQYNIPNVLIILLNLLFISILIILLTKSY